jgi:hypothetical protein
MPAPGWKQLLKGFPWFHGADSYPLPAYSEFMPPPRLGRKPYGTYAGLSFDEADPWGVPVTEYEEAWELRPGLERAAQEIIGALANLGRGKAGHGVARHQLVDNPYWPPELAGRAGTLGHERYVVLLPLALSRTQDEKGRVADHYDTAYTHDHYEAQRGGNGARIAAPGADDNHSATAALMLAAPVLLELSKAGRLGCDVWVIHLTGEEFPADCLGARHLSQALVQGTLKVQTPGGAVHDLSGVRVQGVYVSDMIAHNNQHDRYVFQIAPGQGAESLWLALQAHEANRLWNEQARARNRKPPRRGAGPARRSRDGRTVPRLAPFAELQGEVRPPLDPRSTLYNTDGQIFSDAGVPVVLFMENYDINRTGYHDMEDNLTNIDLDYGAALAAIVIESVARAASERPLASRAP